MHPQLKSEQKISAVQQGFGILENLIVLTILLMAALWVNRSYLDQKQMLAIDASRNMFEEDVMRIFQVTNENVICEHLNFVGSGISIGVENQVLGNFEAISIDGIPLVKKGKTNKYELTSIELVQTSPVFGTNPRRVQAELILTAEFYNAKGVAIPKIDSLSKIRKVLFVVTADASNQIDSCYARFSRRLACVDSAGIYAPEAAKNCNI